MEKHSAELELELHQRYPEGQTQRNDATVITTLGPLPSVTGTRERWFQMFPPFLN